MADDRNAGEGISGADPEVDSKARIADLELRLNAALKTIAVLTDRAERNDAALSPSVDIFGTAARMEQIVAARTREVEEKSAELERANAELQELTENLDQIVRRRTRALVASEEQLRKRNLELRRLNTMKTEFVSIAAHELRTPMTSVVGYLELILEGRYGKASERLRSRIKAVHRNALRMMRLIDQMLSVSRIEAGRVELHPAEIFLGDVVGAVVDELAPLAVSKGHELITTYAEPAPIYADGDKIHQVAANLVTNAIRYTPRGGRILVTVDQAPADKYPGSWGRLRVRDNGVGIPEHLRSRIFDPFADFHTAQHHTSSEPDSAGLGLYVARGLVDLHGGLISVDSTEGEYSEFTVLLPRHARGTVSTSQPGSAENSAE